MDSGETTETVDTPRWVVYKLRVLQGGGGSLEHEEKEKNGDNPFSFAHSNAGGAGPLFTCQGGGGGSRPLAAPVEREGEDRRGGLQPRVGGPCTELECWRSRLPHGLGFAEHGMAGMYEYGNTQKDTKKRWRHRVWVDIDKTPRTATRAATRVFVPARGKFGGLTG